MPKVTLLTMCHNYGNYLSECIDSVLAQTYQDFEYIVVDAGSTDLTPEVIQRYLKARNNFRFYRIDDLGLSSSRNFGFSKANGEYLVNLDADDKLHPVFLERLAARAGEKTLVCPGLREFGQGRNAGWPYWDFSYEGFLLQNRIFCCSMFSAREFELVGGYNPALDWLGFEDYDMWIRMVRDGCHVEIVPELLYWYRVHAGNSTSKTIQRHQERAEYFRKTYGVKW